MSMIAWEIAERPVPYADAVARMEARVEDIRTGRADELIWLLEHPPLYTAGTSAREQDLLEPMLLPVYRTGRGGQFTYHGPGQRVAYVMLDLKRRGSDVRAFVTQLEDWLISTLAQFTVRGERRPGRVGVWVDRGHGREDKIAAIGIRVRHWISYHGISINVDPDLSHYRGIVPCGIQGHGVTSLVDLGRPVDMAAVDTALKESFAVIFGPSGSICAA
ncbi:MAG TPA: lipoyl(octanoyl) transferase LipB [Candidatus Cybelea sp.]|nr:lipoyl(octanoyl) transferase LipB [Candidatus Cybelea sp.]